jgi:anti-anti-sigma regulatory factor
MTTSSEAVRLDPVRWADAPGEAVRALVARPGPDLAIDVAGVGSMPVLVAQILLAAERSIVAGGGRFELIAASDQLKSSLQILGMDHLIEGPKE